MMKLPLKLEASLSRVSIGVATVYLRLAQLISLFLHTNHRDHLPGVIFHPVLPPHAELALIKLDCQ